MTDNNVIDISMCPKNKSAKIFYPDGSLIVETDNELMFYYIRVQIRKLQLSGCYIEFEGQKIKMDRNGELQDYPDGLFDESTKLLLELI